MLSIEYVDTEEKLKIGDLFDNIGFTSLSDSTDESDDSFIKNEWPIEVLSLDGFYPVEGFRWTKPEQTVMLTHRSINPFVLQDCLQTLSCSPDHIVHQQEPAQWTKVKDLKPGDLIVTQAGIRKIESIDALTIVERLCDMQVSIAHSYFTNGVLSHNSHFLTMLGANALKQGKNVLHYTFELSETAVGVRYDSNLCDMESNQVIDRKDEVLTKYKDMKLGRLIIKEFPTNTASIYTLRSHIERLDVKGFRPDVIVVDYADIMRSTRQYDSLRHELKLIYEELRGFASEKGIPIWTASQSNKEGSNSDVVDLSNMSEAYGKAMVADVVLSISRKSHEKATGWGRLFIAKNRAGRDGLVFPVKIDTARSKFEITGQAGNLEESKLDDDAAQKQALRAKWRELKNEFSSSRKESHDDGTNSVTAAGH
jgi:hypothetical protein